MKKYLCEPCGYIYDPEIGDPDGGIAPGTAFEDIPDDWVCHLRTRKRSFCRNVRKNIIKSSAADPFPLPMIYYYPLFPHGVFHTDIFSLKYGPFTSLFLALIILQRFDGGSI